MKDDRVVWRGFRYRWGLTSHRLPRLGTQMTDAGPEFSLRIGAWPPDRATVTTRGCRLDPPARVVERGEVALQVSSRIGQPSRGSAPIAVPSVAGSEVVVVLDGFDLVARVSAAGWHVGALGVSVVDGARIDVELRPAESPHPGIFGLGEWSWDMPCTHDVRVRWAAIAVPVGTARRARGQAKVGSALGTTVVDWEPTISPAGPESTCLLTGFRLRLDAPARQRRRSGYLRHLNGRYLRELGVTIEEGRPAVHVSNAPRFTIRLGAVLGLVVVALTGIATIWATPQWGVGLVALVALGLLTWVWPRVWIQAPAVPWALDAVVEWVTLEGVGAEPVGATWAHVEEVSRPGAAAVESAGGASPDPNPGD